MENANNGDTQEEIILEQEDIRKLNKIIDRAQSALDRSWDSLPSGVQALIESSTINPNLRENLPDQLEIIILFCMQIQSPTFSATMKPSKIFYVDCLSEDLETLVEKIFNETLNLFLQDFCHFLYTSADTIHELLNPRI